MIFMSRPFVSVVVPVLNSEKIIGPCIESLMSQDYPRNKYEIIAVDNGSTDDTLARLERFGNKISILHEPRKGSYRARNTGISGSRGDLILFIDSDCLADPDWMKNLVSAFLDRNVKLAGGRIRGARTDSFVLRYCDMFCHDQQGYFRTNAFVTSNMAVRRKDLFDVGLFDPGLMSGGDIELCRRMISSRDEISYCGDAVVYHHYSPSLFSLMKKNFVYGIWNKFCRNDGDIPLKSCGYGKVLSRYGAAFMLIRLLQDISYHSGKYVGMIQRSLSSR